MCEVYMLKSKNTQKTKTPRPSEVPIPKVIPEVWGYIGKTPKPCSKMDNF